MTSVSDMTRPSLIQNPAWTAASAAAIRPAVGPATDRASSPITTTAPAPITVMVRRCPSTWLPGSPGSRPASAATSAVRGGWSAAWAAAEPAGAKPSAIKVRCQGTTNPRPSARASPASE